MISFEFFLFFFIFIPNVFLSYFFRFWLSELFFLFSFFSFAERLCLCWENSLMLDSLFAWPFTHSKTKVDVFFEAEKVLQVSWRFNPKSFKFPSSSYFSDLKFSTFAISGRPSLILLVFGFFFGADSCVAVFLPFF